MIETSSILSTRICLKWFISTIKTAIRAAQDFSDFDGEDCVLERIKRTGILRLVVQLRRTLGCCGMEDFAHFDRESSNEMVGKSAGHVLSGGDEDLLGKE
jgi:hypothetical protein